MPAATEARRFRSAPRTRFRNEVQKDRRHFAVIEDRAKRKKNSRKEMEDEERERERESMILRRNVAVFPAIHGTDRFFWPLLTTHSYLAA